MTRTQRRSATHAVVAGTRRRAPCAACRGQPVQVDLGLDRDLAATQPAQALVAQARTPERHLVAGAERRRIGRRRGLSRSDVAAHGARGLCGRRRGRDVARRPGAPAQRAHACHCAPEGSASSSSGSASILVPEFASEAGRDSSIVAPRSRPTPPLLGPRDDTVPRHLRILVSNDDGYRAEGLQRLVDALRPLADGDRGRAGPQSQRRQQLAHARRAAARRPSTASDMYFVNGTPTDCVHLAISGLFERAGPRHGRVRHQRRREPRRRRALFGHGGGGGRRALPRPARHRGFAGACATAGISTPPRAWRANCCCACSARRCIRR